MEAIKQVSRGARELGPILAVAIAVSLVSTLAGAKLDHVHQVDAEELHANVTKAVGSGDTQALAISEWGMVLTAPLAAEMPRLSYAYESPVSVGLTAEDLEPLGLQCKASHNGLGSLLRVPAGTFASYMNGAVNEQFIATVGEYDYAYQAPHNGCTDNPAASAIINREMSVLSEALGSLRSARD